MYVQVTVAIQFCSHTVYAYCIIMDEWLHGVQYKPYNLVLPYVSLPNDMYIFRLQRLQAPLDDRRSQLHRKKAAYQFLRDVDDEKMWVAERMPLAKARELGESLFDCHRLQKKNQVIDGPAILHFHILLYFTSFSLFALKLKIMNRGFRKSVTMAVF